MTHSNLSGSGFLIQFPLPSTSLYCKVYRQVTFSNMQLEEHIGSLCNGVLQKRLVTSCEYGNKRCVQMCLSN